MEPTNTQPKLGWSWGAFMYNIAWGIGNKTYLPLICLIPYVNIIWIFVCGACGKKWAWNNGMYSNAEEFNAAMRSWDRAGLFTFIICIIGVLIFVLFFGAIIGAFLGTASNTFNY